MSKPDRSDRGAQFTALPSTADEIRALLKKDDTKSAIDAFDGAVAIGDRGLASEALARVRTGPKTTDYVKKNVLPRMQREFVQKFGAEMTESLQALQEVSAFRLGKRFAQKAISKASGAASFDTVMRGGKSVRVKRDLGGAGGGQFVSQQRAMVQAASRMIRLRRQVGRLEGDLSRTGGFDKPLPSDPIQRAAEIRKRQLERLRKSAPKKDKKKRPRPEVVVPVAEPRPTTQSPSSSTATKKPSELVVIGSEKTKSRQIAWVRGLVDRGARRLDDLLTLPDASRGPINVSFSRASKTVGGQYSGRYVDGELVDTKINIPPTTKDATISFWHEFGHFIDYELFEPGTPDPTSTRAIEPGGSLAPWWDAVTSSKGFQDFREVMVKYWANSEQMADQAEYWMRVREVWARSFAQWAALRTGAYQDLYNHNSSLVAEVYAPSGRIEISSQWKADDFEPIAAAMDNLFRELGWLNS